MMGYTTRRDTMKWWEAHTKNLKYFSSGNSNEHNTKHRKVWLPGYELITGINLYTLLALK